MYRAEVLRRCATLHSPFLCLYKYRRIGYLGSAMISPRAYRCIRYNGVDEMAGARKRGPWRGPSREGRRSYEKKCRSQWRPYGRGCGPPIHKAAGKLRDVCSSHYRSDRREKRQLENGTATRRCYTQHAVRDTHGMTIRFIT